MRLLLSFSLFLLTACTTTEAPKPLLLTEANNNQTISVPVGHNFTVQLAENPTTGYQWVIDNQP